MDIVNNQRLSPRQVLRVFHETCLAVAHMHSRKPPIIHRDLKVYMHDIRGIKPHPLRSHTFLFLCWLFPHCTSLFPFLSFRWRTFSSVKTRGSNYVISVVPQPNRLSQTTPGQPPKGVWLKMRSLLQYILTIHTVNLYIHCAGKLYMLLIAIGCVFFVFIWEFNYHYCGFISPLDLHVHVHVCECV